MILTLNLGKELFVKNSFVVVFVAALALASCGGSNSGGGMQGNGSGDDMQGMDHGVRDE